MHPFDPYLSHLHVLVPLLGSEGTAPWCSGSSGLVREVESLHKGGANGAPTTIKWSDGMAVLSYIGAQGRLLW